MKQAGGAKQYRGKVAPFQAMAERLNLIEKKFVLESQHPDVDMHDFMNGAEINLALTSYYLAMNEVYNLVFNTSNETLVKMARRSLVNALHWLEKMFSTNREFSYEDDDIRLVALEEIPEFKRYELMRTAGFYLGYLESFFSSNSKWYWSFLDISVKFALIFKNTFDFRGLIKATDIREARGAERKAVLSILKQSFEDVANAFKLKYETFRMEADMRQAVNALEILAKIALFMREPHEAEVQKRKIELWQGKLISDVKNSAKKAVVPVAQAASGTPSLNLPSGDSGGIAAKAAMQALNAVIASHAQNPESEDDA